MSNITVGQIIMDAQRMTSRIKDLDALGGALVVEAEGNNRLVESLRQYQDDIESLNRVSNNKSNAEMVNRIQQQNANKSEILKENRELKICIEDYERAMELIMQKYREHTKVQIIDNKLNFKEAYNEKLWAIIREQREKINEMAAVMQRAAAVDDDIMYRDMEVMSRLRMENNALREMLQISKQFGSNSRQIRFNDHLLEEKGVQTEADDSADELSLSGASLENANNNSVIHLPSNPSIQTSPTAAGLITAAPASLPTDNAPLPVSLLDGDNNNGPSLGNNDGDVPMPLVGDSTTTNKAEGNSAVDAKAPSANAPTTTSTMTTVPATTATPITTTATTASGALAPAVVGCIDATKITAAAAASAT